ncbi:MAG: AAA family ATPase, partial [Deltaproteobacteria bacterium]|nr:AAA family ATPase [Deltaproteobacteria bacterium]
QKGGAAVISEQGGGKTHLFERLKNRFENKMMVIECPPGGIDPVLNKFAESLGLDASDLTAKAISDRLQERQIKVVAIDSLHRLSRPAFGGQQGMDQLGELIGPIRDSVFWFYGINWAAWHYISRVRTSRLFLDDILRLPMWTEDQIRELIEIRSSQAGFEPDFSELILPRQFDDIDYETEEERNRFGFYRILWNASDGNPMVSLHLWADSLRIAPDNQVLVSLPNLSMAVTVLHGNGFVASRRYWHVITCLFEKPREDSDGQLYLSLESNSPNSDGFQCIARIG